MKQRFKPGLFVIATAFILFFFNFSIGKDTKKVKKIIVGFSSELFSGVNTRDAKTAIDMYSLNLFQELNKKNPLKFEVTTSIYQSKTELTDAIKRNDCDLLSLTSKEFIELRNNYSLIPALMNIDSKNDECFLLLVNKNKKIEHLKDLKDKRIILTNGGRGDLGLIWLGSILMKYGYDDCNRFFKEIKRCDKQSQAILPVFFGQFDACITLSPSYDEINKLNPQINKKLVALQQSKRISYGMMCFTQSLNEEDRNLITNTAKSMQDYASGKQFLKLFQLPKIGDFNPKLIESVEEFINDYNSYKNKKKTAKKK